MRITGSRSASGLHVELPVDCRERARGSLSGWSESAFSAPELSVVVVPEAVQIARGLESMTAQMEPRL
jgi:hypothetical protein